MEIVGLKTPGFCVICLALDLGTSGRYYSYEIFGSLTFSLFILPSFEHVSVLATISLNADTDWMV